MVERYQIDLLAAAKRAREQMDSELRSMCAAQVPGDTHRNLQVYPNYSGQTFSILVPLRTVTYAFRRKTYQVVINGYTGAIAGKYPLSWVKILIAVLLGLGVAAGVYFLTQK